ncbi:MAG TPA: gluconate 2-dehydrogenase subunit 3 family protein [Chitinophagaceae bacterium]|jgi:hypothetical protein|nr:gluconate 2-dehydrogenase subunit 3 family protein [Chitinophagaceae bacterium]
MNRRESIKALGVGALSAGLLLEGCQPKQGEAEKSPEQAPKGDADRLPEEVERDRKLKAQTFFSTHELATVTALADIIIPRDERSGSASDAGVPDFIEFIVKDRPEHQVPMRGGLRWLDLQCLRRYGNTFVDCRPGQQVELVEAIAYPGRAEPSMKPGVAFFNRMRELTATGFWSSKMGIEDIGFMGNRPNKWEGVPPEILRQYGLEDVTFEKGKQA